MSTLEADRPAASLREAAGRRGSSEDDLPLRLNHAQDRGDGRGLNPTPDERRPAASEYDERVDRKSVVEGKSVDLGGRGVIKEKKEGIKRLREMDVNWLRRAAELAEPRSDV